ncbi:uncharacterized protein LOC129750615 isoform X6 [Uranotaenia lowii]|uniref:uncharacterized protein LOC129750615 isoform X6 n=1 Tax=Uranotaenia lowii TaxID=190385 RepID=UPI00247AAB59|nr:uncharacterized protein LOC129750615 isoform X6 [Uranotaenia lowii]
MKKLTPADKFRRRLAAMKRASKKDKKFFEHDVRNNEDISNGEPSKKLEENSVEVPEKGADITPDSSTNPEVPQMEEPRASPVSSESSTGPKMKSMVQKSHQIPNTAKKRKTFTNNNKKKFIKKLRRFQQLQARHPHLFLPQGLGGGHFGQLMAAPLHGPTGKPTSCCCQCACAANTNHVDDIVLQRPHEQAPPKNQNSLLQHPYHKSSSSSENQNNSQEVRESVSCLPEPVPELPLSKTAVNPAAATKLESPLELESSTLRPSFPKLPSSSSSAS